MGFHDLLAGTIPDTLLRSLPERYDVIGSVAVLTIPPVYDRYKSAVAAALMSHRRSIRTVLNKTGSVDGASRTARYEILAGTDTITTYREYGFVYRFDVLTSFFNPRLQTERKRVTGLVQPGERVLVPFAGVGPFVIPAAARGARIVAVEQNPDAFRWLRENCEKNGVADRVTLVRGDAFDRSCLPDTPVDRIILPTPYGRDTILDVMEPFLTPGGMVHFYTFKAQSEAADVGRNLKTRGYTLVGMRRCGNVAPGISRWVYDLRK